MRRQVAAACAAAALLLGAVTWPSAIRAEPGVTSSEIKIGNTVHYSGPASSYSVLGKPETAFFKMANDNGAVAGHKIDYLSYDDSYSPPETVEQIRRLVEQDHVAFTFATLGTPPTVRSSGT